MFLVSKVFCKMDNSAQYNLILETALGKFRKYGIRRVSMDDIASELRISKKTLYRHFANKETLVRAGVEQNLERIIPQVLAAFEQPGPAAARMLSIFHALGVIPQWMTVEFMSDLKSDYPHLWEEIDTRRHAVVLRVEALLEQAKVNGEIDPSIHPKVVTRILMAIIEHVLIPDVMAQSEFAPTDVFATLSTMFRDGIFKQPSRKGRKP